MGMFDYLRCEMPLPENDGYDRDGAVFQTKSLECHMSVVTIRANGSIEIDDICDCCDEVQLVPKKGFIVFYDYDVEARKMYTWRATVEDYKVTHLEAWDRWGA